jgi:hypothetical protein
MFGRLAEVVDEKLYSLGYGYFWKLENSMFRPNSYCKF